MSKNDSSGWAKRQLQCKEAGDGKLVMRVEKEYDRDIIQTLKALKHHSIGGDETTRTDYVESKVLSVRLTPNEMYVQTKYILFSGTDASTGHQMRQPPVELQGKLTSYYGKLSPRVDEFAGRGCAVT
jgi:hypothetical protein